MFQKAQNNDTNQQRQIFKGNPQNQKKFMLVKREELKPYILENVINVLATLGNKTFQDTYLEIRQVDGHQILIQRTYINEVQAADIQSLWDNNYFEFDIIEVTKLKIKYASKLLDDPDQNHDELLQQILGDLKDFQEMYNNQNNPQFQQIGLQIKQLADMKINTSKIVVFEAFKVLNNTLISNGAKYFAVIGGKQIIQQGTNATLKVLVENLFQGTVVQATQQVGKAFATKALAQGLVVGFVVNTAIGCVKAYYNTGWKNEQEIEIMNLQNNFEFDNLLSFEREYFNDYQNLQEILEEDLNSRKKLVDQVSLQSTV
ncbi:hypothetical protein ABPG74_020134 [Tetrahymena malaccensis]